MLRLPDLAPLIIPVEVAARELDAKLLLSLRGLARGAQVYLGARADIDLHADQLPRGIRLEKGITDASYKMFRNLRDLGCELTAWDEEALVYYSRRAYQEIRLSRRAMRIPRVLLAWGEDNKNLWVEAPQYGGNPVVTTGNPRTDLLRPELRVYFRPEEEAWRAKYGEFILLNSNFGSVNFYDPSRETKLDRYAARAEGAKLRDHRIAMFQKFLDLVPEIAEAFPNRSIVVRPHPAEDYAPWERAAAPFPNVHVLYAGAVQPWLQAAAAMIHVGCTTAIESLLLGKPSFAYRPLASELGDIPLPISVSHQATDAKQLIDLLAMRLTGTLDDDRILKRGRQTLSAHIASLDGVLACDRILDVVTGIKLQPQWSPMALGRRTLRKAKMRLRRARKLQATSVQNDRLREFRKRNFPALKVEEIEDRLSRLGHALGISPNTVVMETHHNVFLLRQR
jgi:surface carbohydrate biosynthesis protein